MQAIILAGGKGTRLKPVIGSLPKLLVPINGKPLLEYLIPYLKKNGFNNIVICIGYMGDKIEEYIKNRNYLLPIKISKETRPLGTGGALKSVSTELEEDAVIVYGDVYLEVNLKKMLKFHKKNKAIVTAVIHPSSHPEDSDLVEFNNRAKITKIYKKPHKLIPNNPYNIGALFVFNREAIRFFPDIDKFDFTHDLLPKLVDEKLPVYGYNTLDLLMDIGTPERLKQVEKFIRK